MPRPRRRAACACGSTARLNTYVSIDGSERSRQLECRSCGTATSHYPSGQEHLAEQEWARINAPGRPAIAAALRLLVGREVVVLLAGSASASIPGLLDLVEGSDGYEVQHGSAVIRFRPPAIARVEGRRVYARKSGRLPK
jgi:hypothetical protein